MTVRDLLKSVLLMAPLPFGMFMFAGALYPSLGAVNRTRIEQGLNGLGNPDYFSFLAMLSIAVISLRVEFRGAIPSRLSPRERLLLYGLPGVALGCCIPYFAGLTGFLIGHPAAPALHKLWLMAMIGFVWSAGFLMLLLLPAHAIIPLKSEKTRRDLYRIVFASFALAAVFYYGV